MVLVLVPVSVPVPVVRNLYHSRNTSHSERNKLQIYSIIPSLENKCLEAVKGSDIAIPRHGALISEKYVQKTLP